MVLGKGKPLNEGPSRRGGNLLLDNVTVEEKEVPPRLQQRNSKGGIVIHEQEIKDALLFLDPHGKGNVLTREDLSKFLENFFPGMLSQKEIKTLIGSGGMRYERLKKILVDNDLTDFDPIAEAFKALDPNGTGVMDDEVFKSAMKYLPDVGDLTTENMNFLLNFMDDDGDGRITLEDFATTGHYGQPDYKPKALIDPALEDYLGKLKL